MSEAITKLVTDLGWSLWTELGVPGVVRHHPHVAIDPEPLIVSTPWLFRADARMRVEADRWIRAHADRISESRLRGLIKAAPRQAEALDPSSSSSSSSSSSKPKPLSLPTTRPALVRFRLRALVGVGARADVLAELLGRRASWLVASDLQHLGYSKRNTARILAELADAGLAFSRLERNAIAYQLRDAEQWARTLNAGDLVWPAWTTVFAFVGDVLRLDAEQEKSAAVRRVAAAIAGPRFEAASLALGLARPPPTAGALDAWQSVIAWAEHELRALVDGTSPALRCQR